MKKFCSFLLAFALIFSFALPAAAAHTEEKYLTDTLTLAGSGFDGVRSMTVSVIEALGETALGYENVYSTMTSGSIFAKHTFKGVKLYELLLNEGLDKTLADTTPIKFIAKDGYTIAMTLGDVRKADRNRYAEKGGALEEAGLPVIVAFSSDGEMLVGPTGTESVYKQFKEADGYVESADNVGGPLRLVMGQADTYEFNAPNCAKWLSAIVVGDDNGYVYSRQSEAIPEGEKEPAQTGDWTHKGEQSDFRLKISGSEAKAETYLSLAELEAMTDGTVRQYFAASAGRNAYEGVTLRYVVESCLADGLKAPTKVTVKSPDGYSKQVDIGMLLKGIDSMYQPGEHRDLLLAWAVDGAALVPAENSEGYNGANAYGPLRLVAENTISMWVKSVSEIVIGEENPYTDIKESDSFYKAALDMYARGLILGVGDGKFQPDGTLSRAQLVTMLWRMSGSPVVNYAMRFADVPAETWYTEAVRWAASEKLVEGYSAASFGSTDPVTREQMATMLSRYAVHEGLAAVTLEENLGFADAGEISAYAVSALNWCVGRGFIGAMPDGRLHPGDNATRAQAAVLLSGYLSK